ncbi:TonB-dependent receptor [Flammeovirga agarivorans]|uniref:TonB-dependent receptor n=1 Tax=Flammeovirga agarivorans TaxID=2726742 RepID=A0A7X8SH42_9BACT|nr:TonB-dependent receptor [Flammeovirga agarivorans]NLR90111.1 TonB-dependent receptor [Flammeovirga agarivorans]
MKSKDLVYYLSLIVMIFGLNSLLHAQGKGAIYGTVLDATGPLPGVSIKLVGTNTGTITDQSGKFFLDNIPTGEQTFEFSFIGYSKVTKSALITEESNIELGTIHLDENATELESVIITSQYLPSQVRALGLQQKNLTIGNVIAADQVGKLPDRNAAEALQRVPGVSITRYRGEGQMAIVRGTPMEWNSMMINGSRLPAGSTYSGGTRSTGLDVFPSELIEYATVTKALTPDMEGDAIGGSINLQTRKVADDFGLNINLGAGYNEKGDQPGYNFAGIFQKRFLDGKLGVIASASSWSRGVTQDNQIINYNYMVEEAPTYSINNMELRQYRGQRVTTGGYLATDYKINERNHIYINGTFNRMSEDYQTRQYTFHFDDNAAEMLTRRNAANTDLFGGEIEGEHHLGKGWKLDWKGSYYETGSLMGTPLNNEYMEYGLPFTYFRQNGVTYGGRSSDGYKYLAMDSPNGIGDPSYRILPHNEIPLNPDHMNLNMILLVGVEGREADQNYQFNLENQLHDKFKLKFGGKHRRKEHQMITGQAVYLSMAGIGIPDATVYPLSSFNTETLPQKNQFLKEMGAPYGKNLLPHITMNELDRTAAWIGSKDAQGSFIDLTDTDNLLLANTYARENVSAAYIMGEWQLNNKLLFVGGIRYENTFIQMDGYEMNNDGNLKAVSPSNTYHSLLPMAHLKYAANEQTNLRFAYTRTFARPNFSQLNPSTSTNMGANGLPTVSGGNMNLNPTYAHNIDLMGEYFFQDIGLVSAGVFFKQLNDVIYTNASQRMVDGTLTTFYRPENSNSGWLAGLELVFSKRLTFLPGFASRFGIDMNYTYTASEIEIPVSEDELVYEPLKNQPKHLYNASLYYEHNGLMLRLAANYKGAFISEYRLEAGANHYQWYDKMFMLDASGSYAINNRIQMYAEVNNLTNAPLVYYHGTPDRPEEVEYYGIRGQIGLRYNL